MGAPAMKSNAPNQRQRVERLLLERGRHGVHSFELFELGMPRAAVIVDRLRKAGWLIDSSREKRHGGSVGVRYVLRTQPVVSAPSGAETHKPPGALFGSAPAASRHYEDCRT